MGRALRSFLPKPFHNSLILLDLSLSQPADMDTTIPFPAWTENWESGPSTGLRLSSWDIPAFPLLILFFLGMKVKNPSSDSSEQSELFPLNPCFFPLLFCREQGKERKGRQELLGSDFLPKPHFFPLGNPGKNREIRDHPKVCGGGKLGKSWECFPSMMGCSSWLGMLRIIWIFWVI